MARLRKVRAALVERPGAAATARAYSGDWRVWLAWCREAGRNPLPASAESIELFLVHEAERGCALWTLRRRLTGIRAGHRSAGVPPPASEAALKLLRELGRDGKGRAKPKAALRVADLSAMIRTLDVITPIGARDRAILLLGLASGLRRGEISALDLADVKFERRGMEVWVRQGKADQLGEGRTIGIWRAKDSALCPVAALAAWLRRRGRWAGPLFTSWRGDRHTKERLLGDGVHDVVKRTAAAAGLDPALYGAHSLRAGCVTAALEAGASLPAIMARTGHKSVQTLSGYYRPGSTWSAGDPLAGAL